jgi:LmbE family N-acetylglucosaminyl deacetylase/uncharacterized membrane protein HdeD (DUF308 family)
MSAAQEKQKRPSYFKELDKKYVQSRGAFLLRALLIIGLGVLLLVAPTNIIEITLLIVFIALLFDGLQRVIGLLAGWTIPHFRPMNIALAVFELGVAALILFRPVGAVRLTAIILSILVIVRGILILATLADMSAYGARQRMWMLVSAVLSIVVGLYMLPRAPGDEDLKGFVNILGLYVLLIGFEQLIRLGTREEVSQQTGEVLETVLSHDIDKTAKFTPGPDPTTGPYMSATVKNIVAKKPLPPRKTHSPSFGTYIDVFKYQRPLVISPHPDDLEGFTGGLVYSLRAPVISVVMSGGDKGRWQEEFEKLSPEQFMEVRLDESTEAAQLLGIERILWMGYRDHGVNYNEQSVQRMLNIFTYLKPDLIVSFEFRKALSYYPHHDHIQTALIVREAARRYVEQGHEVDYLLASTLGPGAFLDVSNVRRIKLEALACHTTQDALNAIIFPFFEKLTSAIWGAFNGVKYAEGYRKVDIRDLKRKPPMVPKEPVA